MERKKRKRQKLLTLLMTACMLFTVMPNMEARANMYEDALEFFNSTGQGTGKHIKTVDGTIYFATSGNMGTGRARNGIKYYHTLGYDVTLTGNGKSLVFSVKRGGSLEEMESAGRIDGGKEYILYRIPTQTIKDLAMVADPANAPEVLDADLIDVRMDAIITVRQNGLMGSLEEDGMGGVTEDPRNGEIFHLLNPAHLSEASRIYNDPFETYTKINAELENFKLDVMYNIGEGARVNAAGYGTGTFNANGSTVSNMLYENGSIWTRSYKLMQEFSLLGTGTNGLNLSKKGYSLPEGKEWTKKDGTTFSAGTTYMPKDISPEAGFGNKGVVLYANWKPNEITIFYNANGGTGAVSPTSTYYDNPGTKLRKNTFERPGFTLKKNEEWNTSPNGTGTSYSSEQLVTNIIDGGEITLYANWVPCVYQITTDKQGGSGGTDSFYQQYGDGFTENADGTGTITNIRIPEKTGYDFMGYYESLYGMGRNIVTSSGVICVGNTYFDRNRIIYADWEPKRFPVTFDKHGGEYGTDTAVATYNEVFPLADAPIRSGYTFQGYYTEENGNGLQIYNEFMASDKVYTYTTGITLHAHWTDETPPKATLNASHDTWTNQKVRLTAEAWDYGSGLSSAVMYRINADGSLTEVAAAGNLGGIKKKTLSFTNEIEGIVRFKLVATDMEGNEAETYQVAYYDITPPQGSVVNSNVSYGNFYFEIDITDINTGN